MTTLPIYRAGETKFKKGASVYVVEFPSELGEEEIQVTKGTIEALGEQTVPIQTYMVILEGMEKARGFKETHLFKYYDELRNFILNVLEEKREKLVKEVGQLQSWRENELLRLDQLYERENWFEMVRLPASEIYQRLRYLNDTAGEGRPLKMVVALQEAIRALDLLLYAFPMPLHGKYHEK